VVKYQGQSEASPTRDLGNHEATTEDYTSKFKAFKAIYKPPKLRNLTHLNSSQPQPSENFNSKRPSNSRLHMRDAKNTNLQENSKQNNGIDFYISQDIMPAQTRKVQPLKH
jgi:dTDP-4-dehydrorhamnose reductase